MRVDIIATSHAPRVFLHNLFYFAAGRYSGLLPYFFPGVLSVLLFLARPRERRGWQWVVGATAFGAAAGLLLYMPYTYSGAGGSIGNRYFMSFYPLFLFLTPPLSSAARAARGDRRWRPVHRQDGAHAVPHGVLSERPCAVRPAARAARGADARQRSDGHGRRSGARGCRSEVCRPAAAYFLDANAFDPEGAAFWVKGRARADVILRAPAGMRLLAAAPRRCASPRWTSTS